VTTRLWTISLSPMRL